MESPPVFDAPEALFLGGSNQYAVAQDRRGRIAVERVEPKNDHGVIIMIMKR
jgi:hypothetical protein